MDMERISKETIKGDKMRFEDCLKLKRNLVKGLFVPDKKVCHNNCAEKTCKWWKK